VAALSFPTHVSLSEIAELPSFGSESFAMDPGDTFSRTALYTAPSVHLRMGERELNFCVDDLLVSVYVRMNTTPTARPAPLGA